MITFNSLDATHVKCDFSDFGVEQEFSEFLTFQVPGAKFTPLYKKGMWDGNIHIYNLRNKKLPIGLLDIAKKFCTDRKEEFLDLTPNQEVLIPEEEIKDFITGLHLAKGGKLLNPRDYQIRGIIKSIKNKRVILVSPTSSGKSLMIYCRIRWALSHGDQVTLVVPSTQLVEQMFSDFKEYSALNEFDVENEIQILYSGKDKNFSKNVLISTWQSICAMKKHQPELFHLIVEKTTVGIFDEAHTFKAKEVCKVLEDFVNTYQCIGTTGTMDNQKINELILIGLIGPVYNVIPTKELMDKGYVVPLKIEVLLLKHPEVVCKNSTKLKYEDEVQYLISSSPRNRFLARLALSTSGNTLILFNYVEKHGQLIYELIKKLNNNSSRKIYFIHGDVPTNEREQIRKQVEDEKDSIIVATSSLFSTGTNIPSIENIIFAFGGKSTIRVRQSIGRSLRLKPGKTHATLYDIADDLSWKKHRNHTLNHMTERIKIYSAEQFSYRLVKLNLKSA